MISICLTRSLRTRGSTREIHPFETEIRHEISGLAPPLLVLRGSMVVKLWGKVKVTGIVCYCVALRNHPEEANSMNHNPLATYSTAQCLLHSPLQSPPHPLSGWSFATNWHAGDGSVVGWNGWLAECLVVWLAWHRHWSWNLLDTRISAKQKRPEEWAC